MKEIIVSPGVTLVKSAENIDFQEADDRAWLFVGVEVDSGVLTLGTPTPSMYIQRPPSVLLQSFWVSMLMFRVPKVARKNPSAVMNSVFAFVE